MDGILIVDKPEGITSHQVVGRARRALGTRKIGHAGTLDPMATGVLILGVNRATRMLGHLALHDKAYTATIRLGQSTNTDDADGEITQTVDASRVDEDQVRQAIVPLTGHIMQVPSTVSAIKVGGKRAYALARAGEDVALEARSVFVHRFDLVKFSAHEQLIDVDVEVEVSSGTYVRALARDLGSALGVGAHLTALRRTRIGKYRIDQAIPLDEVAPESLMSMADAAKLSFPVIQLDEPQAKQVHFGRRLEIEPLGEVNALLAPDGKLLALYQPDEFGIRPLAVFVG